MNKNKSVPSWTWGLVVFISLTLGWQGHELWSDSGGRATPNQSDTTKEEEMDMRLFWNVWSLVESNYVDIEEITEENQIYGAISGLVDALEDPYSVFMSPEDNEMFQSSLNGDLEGIGAELTVEDGKLVIVTPLKNTPAEQEGLLPGDHIYLVNDEPTSEMTLWEAIMQIRGEPGTDVTLTILREGEDEALEFTITRQHIDVPSVELSFETSGDATFAHMEVYQFGDDTYNEFETAVREVLLQNPDGLILDLRMNGGGYLDVSVDMLSEFLEDKETAVIVKRRGEENELVKTYGNGQLADIPLVVLIDEGSASASEIMAGALQDYGRAVLMGKQSFGKGSVQELIPLGDGSSLRLTIAKWYTPLDRGIDEVGIAPDVTVEMDPLDRGTDEDLQLDAAIDYLSQL